MKKILIFIVMIFSIFSIGNETKANDYSQWLIENILNLNYGPLIFDLNLEKLESYDFRDPTLRKMYDGVVIYNNLTKQQIINTHKVGHYDYYTTNGIIKNYKTFISYTNDFFYYLNIIDKNPNLKNDTEIQEALLITYRNSQSYYRKVRNLVSKKISKK